MSLTNLLLISFLNFLEPTSSVVYNYRSCEITVTSQVKNANAGRANGEISLAIAGDSGSDRYKVFLLNKGQEQAKNEIKSKKLTGLKPGRYEFIIVDTKGDKCFKELTLNVTEG
jgi:hypothetical protein